MRRACGVPTFTVTLQPDLKPHEGYSEQFHVLSPSRKDRVTYRIEQTLLWTGFGARARARRDFYRDSAIQKFQCLFKASLLFEIIFLFYS